MSGAAAFARIAIAGRLILGDADGRVRRQLALAVVLVLVSAAITGITPLAFKLLVDGYASGNFAVGSAAGLLAAYIFGEWLARALSGVRSLVYARAEQRLQRRTSLRALDHVLNLPMRFHLDRKTGALTHAMADGLAGHKVLLHHLVHTVLPVAAELLTMAVVIAWLGAPALVAILIATSSAYVVAFVRGAARISGPARAVSNAHVESYAVLADSLLNTEAIKCYGAEAFVREKYNAALETRETNWLRYHRMATVDALIIATILASSLGATIAYASAEVARGGMTIGGFVLVNAYMLRIVTPLEALGIAIRDLVQAVAYFKKLLTLFEERQEPRSGRVHTQVNGPAALAFDHVNLAYGPDIVAVKDVSFSVEPGRTVAVVGPTGCGKSSLVRLLVRLYEPTGGRILLDGAPIKDVAIDELRRSVAVVPQDTVMFNDTIAANIAVGRPGSTRKDVERAARIAHLHTFVVHLPRGYDTVVGERGLKLSGGERQRLAIARAMLRNPRVFVLDEATSSLDTNTERGVLAQVAEASLGRTTLIIAHRLSAIAHADEIVVLERGCVVERGTHDRLLRTQGLYAGLWRAQGEGKYASLSSTAAAR